MPNLTEEFSSRPSFSHAGDFNGDGIDDLVINSYANKKVYLVFGTEERFEAEFDLTTVDGTNGLAIANNKSNIRLGDSVSNAGDLNGDGFSDLIIGDPAYAINSDEYGGLGRGKAYVVFGTDESSDAEFDLTTLDGKNGFSITGIDIDDNLGDAVSNGGDLNGDGFDDLVISAPSAEESIKFPDGYEDVESEFNTPEGYSDREIQGEVYVVFGTDQGFDAEFDLTTFDGENGLAIASIDEGSGGFRSGFGETVNSAGDLNRDGFADLVISSLYDGANVAYVVFGSPNLQQLITSEKNLSLVNPMVTILEDEDDGDLSENDISLREAILYSNDGDTVTFNDKLKDETILLTLGELAIDKSLTIQGFADSELTIDGNSQSRVFNIDNNFSLLANVNLNNLTITGGNTAGSGGGVFNQENLTINNSVITSNTAGSGGGISSSSSSTTINDSVISENFVEFSGGGIENSGVALQVNRSIVTGNSTNGSGGGIGSGYSYGSIRISDSSISENQADYSGGGIDAYYIEILNSTISGNKANQGGGLDVGGFDGGSTIVNSTISGNAAVTKGGGVFLSNIYGYGTILNTTITDNSASEGGGVYRSNDRSATVTSSIIAGNVNDSDVGGGGLLSEGNNLIGNGTNAGDFINLIDGDQVGTADNPLDPQLGELQDNGGNTFTHALLPESRAINAGSNPRELTTDQRGEGFERILFGAIDVGAFEANSDSIHELPILPPEPVERIVTVLDDEDDGNLNTNDISLREAIVNSNPGDTITFDPSLTDGTITLTLGELVVDNNLIIRGLGEKNLTIDANNQSRVFKIDDGSNNLLDVTIERLTITGGNADEEAGGGIKNQENLTVNRSIITGNSAAGGGGILTDDNASTTINNSTVSNNSASNNGGGISTYSATTTINNSTISGNFASISGGGTSSVSFYGGGNIINNSTISGNSAGRNGGGIDAFDSSLEIANSTVTDNIANNNGSGVYIDFSSGTIASSIIAGNANNHDIAGGGNFTSEGNNLVGNGDVIDFTGNVVAAFANDDNSSIVGTSADPLDSELGELKDNGGFNLTHALLPNSPAIDAGSNPNTLASDQRGLDRSVRQTDIGAFEVQADSLDISDYEVIEGNSEDNNLTGSDRPNIISGNDGNDTLNGGRQFDRLNGGTGNDVLSGGGGSNVLKGDAGSDLFYLENTAESIAWIRDFEFERDLLGLADGITYNELEITGRVNSFIDYQGRNVAVILEVNPEKLTRELFTES